MSASSWSLPEDEQENALRVARALEPLLAQNKGAPVFLVDGDRTLSPEDTSRRFLSLAGLDPMIIKRRFQRDGYVFGAFRFHAEVHVSLGEAVFSELAPKVAADALLHIGADEFLRAAIRTGQVVIVSAGIPRIWRCILDRLALSEIAVVGGLDPRDPFVFGRSEKGQVARAFRGCARCVVALGDSDVDTEMMQLADTAVVVMNHHRNSDLLPSLRAHTSLWQVVPDGEPHEGVARLGFPDVARLPQWPPQEEFACR